MRKTALGCTILEGHDIADLPLVSENSEILEAEIARKTALATPTSNGLMSATDKDKLDNVSTQMADFAKKTDLAKITAGSSGAKSIGVSTITGLTGNDVQTCLQNLFQYANDGKTKISNALKTEGITASSSETFASLASKIQLVGDYKVGDYINANSLGLGTYTSITKSSTISNFTNLSSIKWIGCDLSVCIQWNTTSLIAINQKTGEILKYIQTPLMGHSDLYKRSNFYKVGTKLYFYYITQEGNNYFLNTVDLTGTLVTKVQFKQHLINVQSFSELRYDAITGYFSVDYLDTVTTRYSRYDSAGNYIDDSGYKKGVSFEESTKRVFKYSGYDFSLSLTQGGGIYREEVVKKQGTNTIFTIIAEGRFIGVQGNRAVFYDRKTSSPDYLNFHSLETGQLIEKIIPNTDTTLGLSIDDYSETIIGFDGTYAQRKLKILS